MDIKLSPPPALEEHGKPHADYNHYNNVFTPILDRTDKTLSPMFTSLSLSPCASPMNGVNFSLSFDQNEASLSFDQDQAKYYERCISPVQDVVSSNIFSGKIVTPVRALSNSPAFNQASSSFDQDQCSLSFDQKPAKFQGRSFSPILDMNYDSAFSANVVTPSRSMSTSPSTFDKSNNFSNSSQRGRRSPFSDGRRSPFSNSIDRNRCSPIPNSRGALSQSISSSRSFTSPNPSSTRGHRDHRIDYGEQKWLEKITKMLDEVPLGELTLPLFNEAKPAMNAWAKSRCKKSGIMVEQILKRIIDEEMSGNTLIKVTTAMYTMAIDGWAKSGDTNGPKRAEEILFLMMQTSEKAPNKKVHPDVQSFTTVIDAWAKSNSKGAAKRAEDILELMHRLVSEGNTSVKPTTATYNAVINAWSKSGEKGSAEHAESYLQQMEEMFAAGNEDVKPDELSFNSVIAAWARSPSKYAARKAEEILERMENLQRCGYPGAKADTVTYNTVISVWARAGVHGAAKRCEDILRRMEQIYENGDLSVKPDVISYSTVIDAWAKSGEKGAAHKAELVVFRMQELYDGSFTDVKPSAITFTAVLDAWARSGEGTEAANRAENILQYLEESYRAGNIDLKPTTVTYTTVIAAWARSRHPQKAVKAQQILRRMSYIKEKGSKPNVVTYNAVINACAFTCGSPDLKRMALAIATETYNEIRLTNSLSPDSITYSSLMKSCSNLLPMGVERNVAVAEVFGMCCQDGQVNEKVLMELRHAASGPLLNDLLGPFGYVERVNCNDLPRQWTKSVRERKGRGGGCGKSRAGGRIYLKR